MNAPSRQSIDLLLAKLGSDDQFRAEFAVDPAKALAGIGITLAACLGAAGVAPADQPVALADKSSFVEARAELHDGLAPAPFIPITLDFTERGLASKEAFQQARATLREGLSPAPFNPITLDFAPKSDHA